MPAFDDGPVSDRISEDEIEDFFRSVDRARFPDTEDKARPWLDMDLGWTEDWEPYRWTVRAAGKAAKPIYVTVAWFYANVTGGHW